MTVEEGGDHIRFTTNNGADHLLVGTNQPTWSLMILLVMKLDGSSVSVSADGNILAKMGGKFQDHVVVNDGEVSSGRIRSSSCVPFEWVVR
jgi:hypothetical protein